MINIVKIDSNRMYVSHREASKYDTWGRDELRGVELPQFQEGKFYKWDGNEWVVLSEYPTPIIDIEALKVQKKAEIKKAFDIDSDKPIVDTGLGFSVDGAYRNKTDFETGKKYSFPQVRASDNTMHDVTSSDYDTIIQAIEMNGIAMYQRKWELEAQIDSATTIQELEVITW